VAKAYEGRAAVELAGSFRPQLALLDIGMPELDGYDVARRIRKQPGGREAILVALTGWGQHEDRRRAVEEGFDHHIVKPVDLTVLRKLLDTP
jgi:CheY-like chemotaxis protein